MQLSKSRTVTVTERKYKMNTLITAAFWVSILLSLYEQISVSFSQINKIQNNFKNKFNGREENPTFIMFCPLEWPL